MESFEELGRWDVVEGVVSYVKTMGEKEGIRLYVAHQSEQEANDFLSFLSLSLKVFSFLREILCLWQNFFSPVNFSPGPSQDTGCPLQRANKVRKEGRMIGKHFG